MVSDATPGGDPPRRSRTTFPAGGTQPAWSPGEFPLPRSSGRVCLIPITIKRTRNNDSYIVRLPRNHRAVVRICQTRAGLSTIYRCISDSSRIPQEPVVSTPLFLPFNPREAMCKGVAAALRLVLSMTGSPQEIVQVEHPSSTSPDLGDTENTTSTVAPYATHYGVHATPFTSAHSAAPMPLRSSLMLRTIAGCMTRRPNSSHLPRGR